MSKDEQATQRQLEELGYEVLQNGWPDFLAVSPDMKRGIAVECKVDRECHRLNNAKCTMPFVH